MIRKIGSKVKRGLRQTDKYIKRQLLQNQRKKRLAELEEYHGKLTDTQKKAIDEYAIEVLGSKDYSLNLQMYATIAGEFREGWIPASYFREVVVPYIKGDHGRIARLKTINNLIFNSEHFPDKYYYINHKWYTRDYQLISREQLEREIHLSNKKLIYKPNNSARGDNIRIIESDDINDITIYEDGVLQDYIVQHPFFEKIMPNSVATIRMTTVREPSGKISLRSSHLRTGRTNDIYIKVSSQIRCPISLDSGELGQGYDSDYISYQKHPDTGVKFKNKILPEFEKCKNVVFDHHKKILFNKVIGWDVIVDINNKVQIIECQGWINGIDFPEIIQGPTLTGLGLEDLWKKVV